MKKKPQKTVPASVVELAHMLWALKREQLTTFYVAHQVIFALVAMEQRLARKPKAKKNAKKKAAPRR